MTQTSLPELEGQPTAATPDPTWTETFGAGWTAEMVRTDTWSYSARVRDQLFMSIYDRLDDAAKDRVWNYRQRNINDVDGQETLLLDEAGKLRAAGDPVWQDLPATRDEMTAEVDRRRRDVLDDAEAVLGAGPGTAGFLGGMARGATDPISLLMAPLGAGGALWKVTAREALLGAVGEGLVLPRERQVAEELDLPEPAILPRLAMGAAAGGAFGLAFAGAERLGRYVITRRAAARESRPAGVGEIDHADEIETRRHEMEFGPGAEVKPPAAGTLGDILKMGDFDFSRTGNASPVTNRIGYVYGRLLERGMEPHIAAGFVGNFMAESGPGLNTRAVGDGGAAFGLAQWNDRRAALFAFAEKAGKDPGDLDVQIDFVMHELATSEAPAMAKIAQASNAREAAALVSQYYERPGTPHLPRRVAYAETVARQHEAGQVPKWEGPVSPSAEGASGFTGYGTSRGYTGTGQVAVGDNMRVDVAYEVVDASLLRRATGELQPRDRSRIASDAWISDTAARLDPAQLMPAPTADRGAPLIGPDNVIESGNGRFAAIERAYERHPDRADAYRKQIEATTGAPIPEGIERPVLVARRTSELDDAARRQLVVEAQDSGVARMTAAERARVGTRALDADMLARLDAGTKLSAASNRDFARAFAGHFPRAERNAFVGPDGRISADGIRQIQDSLFARAWDAPDIVARALEAEPGELKSLLDALASAGPEVAMLRADIAAGLVRPEMDITPFVLDAVRLIVTARELAERGGQVAELLDELLAEVDLLDGAIAPLTQALVRLFAPNGRQAPAGKIADFVKRYATEARKAGQTGDALLDPPGPLDVLKRIAPEAFGDLTEMGASRAVAAAPDVEDLPATAYNDGATSPEAEAAADLAQEQLEAVIPARPDMAEVADPKALEADLKRAQPVETMDDIFALAPEAQAFLTRLGQSIETELGVKFKDPGFKKRETAEEKMGRKRYAHVNQITDVARAGFIVRNADEAELIVSRLAAGAGIMDEGWSRNAVGYVDRKVLVVTPNGLVAEVQLWAPKMLEAKKAGGHALYEKARASKDEAEIERLNAEQLALYTAALGREEPSLVKVSGGSNPPKVLANLDFRASAEPTTRPVSATSSASTASQAPPGSSSAIASPRGAENSTAGRPSQSANTGVMADTSTPDIAPGEASFNDVELTLPDGNTVSARELLDDLDADEALDTVIDLCATKGTADG